MLQAMGTYPNILNARQFNGTRHWQYVRANCNSKGWLDINFVHQYRQPFYPSMMGLPKGNHSYLFSHTKVQVCNLLTPLSRT